MRTVLAIPTYNCASQLGRVLRSVAEVQHLVHEIWVVDNRSADNTVNVALALKPSLKKLRVFINQENYSLGGTHKICFNEAKSRDFSHIIILHGDDQASAADIPSLIHESSQYGLISILGSRFKIQSRRVNYDWKRVAGNLVLNFLYSVLTGRLLSDLGSGLNLYRVGDLDDRTYLSFGNTLTFNYELILDLINRDVPFRFSPIQWREEDQTSNAKNWSVFRIGIQLGIVWRLKRRRYGSPDTGSFENVLAWSEV